MPGYVIRARRLCGALTDELEVAAKARGLTADALAQETIESYLASLRLPTCTLLISSPRSSADMAHDGYKIAIGPDE